MTRNEQIGEAAMHEAYKHTIQEAYYCEIYFEMGAKWADSHPNWISVDDELPKDDSLVLTITHSGSQRVGFYNDGWWMVSIYISRMGSITHWMPLPSPPRREDEK